MSENFISDNYYILVSCFIMAWSKLTEVVEVVCLIKEWDNGNWDNVIKMFKIQQLLMIKLSNKRDSQNFLSGPKVKLCTQCKMETLGFEKKKYKISTVWKISNHP